MFITELSKRKVLCLIFVVFLLYMLINGKCRLIIKDNTVIKVQDGCDRFCSYCVIPYARGRVRSRKPENIIAEIEKIAQNNIKEVVITGIHIASYGKDFKDHFSAVDLNSQPSKLNTFFFFFFNHWRQWPY